MNKAMNKIVALWAVPRSTSTAFEWMMRMRGDMTCFHEPFGEVWYQGESPDWPRLQPDSVRTPGLTYESAWNTVRAAAAEGPVFVKDFPHYLRALWSDAFFDCFTHSFLIRDPAKAHWSMYRHWPDFHIDETGYPEQRALFDELTAKSGRVPPVIDSDDLLTDPAGVVAAWCEAVGIPFIEGALRWTPGARDEVSWWDGGSFHENLRHSRGLEPQSPRSVDITAAPRRVREAYEITRPHYDHLYAHRMKGW
ncbi:sulfotransferase family protein [Candidatus Poriferisocius sp.]|uniref:sulfotransferase-like domain-containing protein n=1 Tax=Candidatus Poriferisocius sp. TaxID=3101276 RepID=UPI003B591E5F